MGQFYSRRGADLMNESLASPSVIGTFRTPQTAAANHDFVAPPGSVPSEETVEPPFVKEAEVLVKGILAIVAARG